MPEQDDIVEQQRLLKSYRQTLSHYLNQRALLGAAHVPPGVANGIVEAREAISRIKQTLRDWSVPAVDLPNDMDGLGSSQENRDNGATQKPVSSRALRLFLCHSSEDKPAVRNLYHQLRSDGVEPWLDEEEILPGQDWELEIPRAVRNSDTVIVCLSKTSISKAGYIQQEIRYALDVADRQPEGAIFIIPLKWEECDVPERLRRWQWVNFFEERGYERLLRALRSRAIALGIASSETLIPSPPITKQSEYVLKSRSFNRETGFLTFDSRPLLGEQGETWRAPYFQFHSVDDLLDYVYACLNERVSEYTYTDVWLLRDLDSAHVFSDMGTKWAENHLQNKRDKRSLEQVGIVAGMLLEIIAPDGQTLPLIEPPPSTTPTRIRPIRRRKLSRNQNDPNP